MRTAGPDGEFNADFDLEPHVGDAESFDVILKSSGGVRTSPSARNPDYKHALEEILRRLSLAEVNILNIEVDSTVTRSMSPQERRLPLEFPISLRQETDVLDLRLSISRAQPPIGRGPNARPNGGNPEKQIRIQVSTNHRLASLRSAEDLLSRAEPPREWPQREDHLEPNNDPADLGATEGELRTYERGQVDPTQVRLREEELVRRYKGFLNSQGQEHAVRRTGEQRELEIDLINVTTDELIEAKSAADRDHIRYAIGQLMDYGRFLEPASKAILLPERPSSDLLELIRIAGVVCVFEETSGAFRRIEP